MIPNEPTSNKAVEQAEMLVREIVTAHQALDIAKDKLNGVSIVVSKENLSIRFEPGLGLVLYLKLGAILTCAGELSHA